LLLPCRAWTICEAAYQRWRTQYGGMKSDEAKRLKELEIENSRLKRLLADAELDKAMLKEGFHNQNYPDYIADGIIELSSLPQNPASLTVWTSAVAGLRLSHYFGSELMEMVQSHGMEFVFFGLLHHDDKHDQWNAYDKYDPRRY
jgi:hypothetical protein